MWLVVQKELKELLRDRKTLFFMVALPMLVFPAMFGAIGYFTSKALDDAQNKVLNFAVIGAQYHPELVAKISEDESFSIKELADGADFKQQIKDKTLDFVIELDANADGTVLDAGQSTLKLYLNDAGLNMVESRIEEYVATLNENKRQAAFDTLSVPESKQLALLKPVVLEKVNIAEARENWGERIGGLIPYMLFILCLQGAMVPASDLAAGEKERGTLETLLLVPLDRTQLVMGKFFTVLVAAIVAALVTIFSMAFWGIMIGQGMAITFIQDMMTQIAIIDYILMFVMLVPVASIFAAILLSLSIYARSYKEAQSYMGSLIMLVILPIVVAMAPGITLEGIWAWVPLTNVALAIKELIKGTMDYYALLGILTSTVIIAGALLAFCVYWFKQEKVLFR
ncbi:ABC transporter permease [Planctobacterium marinum]|uniref:ABC-2 type transporter transmembrane domain-containing protein n=1 Tax=Planctobacterium marinum TaxID=1631968 RepID=A0AA48I7M1_9ALTE|nr:hypothetical protein MACH26_29760 [Planctobacterium marinum]